MLEQVLTRQLARWAIVEPDWEEVYVEQLPRVLNFFRYRVGTAAGLEDLTAGTFETAWRTRYRYQHDLAGFSAWLFAMARSVAIDHLYAHRRHEPRGVATSLDRRPELRVRQGSDAERLSARLATLPPRQRELIAMKYGAGLTSGDIARATGLSESHAETILHRAVERCASAGEERTLRQAWFSALQSEPSPAFAQQLRARLRVVDAISVDVDPRLALDDATAPHGSPASSRHALAAAAALVGRSSRRR